MIFVWLWNSNNFLVFFKLLGISGFLISSCKYYLYRLLFEWVNFRILLLILSCPEAFF